MRSLRHHRHRYGATEPVVTAVIARPGDPFQAMRHLLEDNNEDRPAQRRHIRRAIAICRSLLVAGVVERLYVPEPDGRRVRLTVDLQDEFALNQPLAPFALAALDLLDRQAPTYVLDAVSVIEAREPLVVHCDMDRIGVSLVHAARHTTRVTLPSLSRCCGHRQHQRMNMSVTLSLEDLAVLDAYVRARGLPSRSAALLEAGQLLNRAKLEEDYAAAWDECDISSEREAWDGLSGDVLAE